MAPLRPAAIEVTAPAIMTAAMMRWLPLAKMERYDEVDSDYQGD